MKLNFNDHKIEILNNFFDLTYLDEINEKIYNILKIKNITYNRNDNCIHHLLTYDKIFFLDILEKIIDIKLIHDFFRVKFILHSFGAVINKPSIKHYTHNYHIDSYEPNISLMLNILIPLNDFTLENGCTKIYLKDSKEPIDLLLKKGDILIFDSSLLHATGENKSNFDRNCLTITLTKIYCKPQFNYKVLYSENEINNMNSSIQNILNINSQLFENLDDFYNKKYIFK